MCAVLTDVINIPDEGSEIQESSIVSAHQAVEPPPYLLRERSSDKEYRNTDSEDQSSTDEASDNSAGYTEDIPSRKPRTAANATPRTLRSRTHKQEPANLGQQIQNIRPVLITGKRSYGYHESESKRPTKRGRKPAGKSEVKKFERDALDLVERFNSNFRDLEAIRSENEGLKIRIEVLEMRLEQAQQAQTQLEVSQSQKVASLQNECKKWRIQLAQTIDEHRQDSSNYVKVPDSDIVGMWMKLAYNIRDLISQCFTEQPPDQSKILEQVMTKLEKRVPSSSYGIASLRIGILRRAIWIALIRGVFSGKWHMKSKAIASLGDETKTNEEALGELIDKVGSFLRAFIPAKMMESFKIKMGELIRAAADLHTTMMKSKAIFLVQWIGDGDGEHPSPYKPSAMESLQDNIETDASNYFVEFVEAPALVKVGTADGEDFDLSMILCKSAVILREKDDS
ncbi:hypothetical protein TARUN_9530 [Trichoderma arundinaceum]|uniref:Uncharacterized protein n=1 Tax=Trichoderma arundinaceum TaxID=490622 RepID=A0A395NA82_TRIAR|nr:hypothetical protein TARUN_9530 [Trichoderma arundinaceum]